MNLRNKRKVSSNLSEENDSNGNSNQAQANENTNSNQANFSSTQNNMSLEKEGNGLANSNSFISTTDQILVNGNSVSKKIKTNSGVALQTLTSGSAPCLKSAEQIIQHQQNVNNDCDIDCDGFREIFPEDLHTQLQEAIYSESTIVLREAAGPKGFNVNPKNLFSFETVIKNHSEMQIDCRIQNPTVYGFNVQNPKNQQHVYNSTIQEYGEYAALLEEDRYDEIKKKPYYKEYFSKLSNGVMFAVNIDMDDYNWKTENMRLRSGLPHYLLNKGKHDILSYHRQNVMGCTQPQMYLKVAGVWTGGHQENISVRAININHGDGDSDWYCVDFEQVEKYRNYIKKKYQVDIHSDEGLWFGKYNDPDVIKAGIKIKKVVQRKNDIVILAPGVLHWVRCRGRSVQTAWNFAYRRIEDIVAMNERFLYNQKINFQTIILNKSLFMDLLNFEYHNLPLEVAQKLHAIVSDYYNKEYHLEQGLTHYPSKAKNKIIFYDQMPAQLKHIQIYYCSQLDCTKEIFCYFGILHSEFQYQDPSSNILLQQDFCGKYFCPNCILDMKKMDDSIILFRKFDLHSLKTLLNRVQNYIKLDGKQQSLYPISDLTNISHFCGQIDNINDFVFNKDVRRLEQVYIPDVFASQGVEEMQKFQLDLQSGRLIDFIEKPIMKFVMPNQQQRCETIYYGEEELLRESQKIKIEDDLKKEEDSQPIQNGLSLQVKTGGNKSKNQHLMQQQEISLEQKESQSKIKQHQQQLNFESVENKDLSQQQQNKNVNQHDDEKLAIQLQHQYNYEGSKTRKQKNNSQLLNSSDFEISSHSQHHQPRVLRGGRSLCSKPPSQNQNQRKKPQQNQITSLKSISESNNSSKESSKQNQNEAQSPTSSSTTIGASTNITSPSLQVQQNEKAKKEESNEQPPQNPQMILEETLSTPNQKTINNGNGNRNNNNNSSQKSSTNNQNIQQNQETEVSQKTKIKTSFFDDDDENDQEEIEKQKIRKIREEQKKMMMEAIAKSIREEEPQNKQPSKEAKQMKTSSSDLEDQSIYKKRLSLKQIANNSN